MADKLDSIVGANQMLCSQSEGFFPIAGTRTQVKLVFGKDERSLQHECQRHGVYAKLVDRENGIKNTEFEEQLIELQDTFPQWHDAGCLYFNEATAKRGIKWCNSNF